MLNLSSLTLSFLILLFTELDRPSGDSRSLDASTNHGDPPNILLILVDDFGVELMASYGEGSAPPCTPELDALAAESLLFCNVWTNPTCSPTRAAILTGRYGFRNGIGEPVTQNGVGLDPASVLLPTALPGYTHACVGKWHLSGSFEVTHPNDIGFTNYAGSLQGDVRPAYDNWNKTINGDTNPTTNYATTDTAEDVIAAISTIPAMVLVRRLPCPALALSRPSVGTLSDSGLLADPSRPSISSRWGTIKRSARIISG